MRMHKKLPNRLVLSLLVFLAAGVCFTNAQEHDKIVEKVDVVNVVLPVRVYHKGEPVKGLTAENFKIRIDGKNIPINGFFEESQKISVTRKVREAPKPRLFVLVFNINDYNMSLTQHLDTIFEKIIRPGDRLMIVSNNFFLTDRPVKNIKKVKARLKRILEIEALEVRKDMRRIEYELKTLAEEFIWQVADGDLGVHPQTLMRDFIIKYKDSLESYKMRYANIVKTQGLRMANFLKNQDAQKWVINFHQVGMFPQLKSGTDRSHGGLRAKLDELGRKFPWIRADLSALDTIYNVAEGNLVKQYSKYFLNSEVTFHTILMKGFSNVAMDHYDYRAISTEAENMMRRITRMTGGEEMGTNIVGKFIDRIIEKEDVYYVLSYNPGGNKDKIKVSLTGVDGKNYEVVYDNQQRPWYIKQALKKIQKQQGPMIAIKKVSYSKGILAVSIAGIKMGQLEGESQKKGKIHMLIQILDQDSKVMTKVEKAFKCKEEKFVLRMKPPALKKGNYDIVVRVTDLLTGDSDAEVEKMRTP